MRLLVILLCLFFERFLVHGISHERFAWLDKFRRRILGFCEHYMMLQHPIVEWFLLWIIPVGALVFVLCITDGWLWGILSFLLNIVVFYYCLGPDNPFYPPAAEFLQKGESPAQPYFESINHQLFTPILCYLILGPSVLFFFRMNKLLSQGEMHNSIAEKVSNVIEWVPARITALTFMLAGHFQNGMRFFRTYILSSPRSNQKLLSSVGIASIEEAGEPVSLPRAESLVEQALVIYLVGCAVITIALWL